MIYLDATTDKLQLITDAAAAVSVQANFIDANNGTLAPTGGGNQNTAISTATTTDILAAPAASTIRTLKQMTIRNKDAALTVNVTVQFNANATLYEIHKVTLTPGDMLEYIEGVGFFICTNTSTLVIDANGNTSDVTASAANTYLTGSNFNVTGLLQAGTSFHWSFAFTKTAAGVAAPVFTIVYGTAGTTADTARCTLTLGSAQTAAADTGWADLIATFRVIGASAVLQASLRFEHKNTTTGLASAAQVQIIQALSASFDSTPSGSIIGVCCNPGASGVWTFQNIFGRMDNALRQR